jgi:Flp pilus assembly protein TadG
MHHASDRTGAVPQRTRQRDERGVAMLAVVAALVALIAAASLAIDVGMVLAARTQLQNAADAAALAAATGLIDPNAPQVTLSEAESAGVSQAAQNFAVSAPSVNLDLADFRFGRWDTDVRALDTSVDLTDPEQVTGVEVTARLDGAANGPVPALMARVLGRDQFAVTSSATAYLGYAGRVGPGQIDLPIAIDCCKLKGPECNDDYCDTITQSPPNPCPLEVPQLGDGMVSCLEFHNTGEQNACWTVFDGDHPPVNTPGLIDIIENGNGEAVSIEDPIYLDNGDKTPVIAEISDRFHGDGAYFGEPDGVDRYEPFTGTEDSWVVGLPVVECQTEAHCATGSPMQIVGYVCFEIREVLVTPEKIIKGRFLCPNDPLMAECDIGPSRTGGNDFGVRAQIPVLVR